MRVQPIKTHPITGQDDVLLAILDRYLTTFQDGTILAITSKIVSICQGRTIPVAEADKQDLIEQEADYWLPPEANRYGVSLTIVDHVLIPMAGVDESNAAGHYILWPRDPQHVANQVRGYLGARFALNHVGVIITDSKTTPLRWGVTGVAIAHSGFLAVNDLVGHPDLFGRPLHMTKVDVADALAAAAVLVMGEADEGTPLALIEDLPFVTFQARDPTPAELEARWIDMEADLYAPLLQAADWRRGERGTGPAEG
ncbi:MAG TPA: coenzyme F420-0:L-glutamate ligase [Anaerolineae bacterium]|nr:coenzyme F420-0:L-glutamate ligase [Anaerolineae bacterium]